MLPKLIFIYLLSIQSLFTMSEEDKNKAAGLLDKVLRDNIEQALKKGDLKSENKE